MKTEEEEVVKTYRENHRQVSTRFRIPEYDELLRRAENQGLSISSYMRMIIIKELRHEG